MTGEKFDAELLGYIKDDVAPVINIYSYVSSLAAPAYVNRQVFAAVSSGLAVLQADTGNPPDVKAWAAVGALQEFVPRIMRHGGLELNARWKPRTMEDYLLEKKERESW